MVFLLEAAPAPPTAGRAPGVACTQRVYGPARLPVMPCLPLVQEREFQDGARTGLTCVTPLWMSSHIVPRGRMLIIFPINVCRPLTWLRRVQCACLSASRPSSATSTSPVSQPSLSRFPFPWLSRGVSHAAGWPFLQAAYSSPESVHRRHLFQFPPSLHRPHRIRPCGDVSGTAATRVSRWTCVSYASPSPSPAAMAVCPFVQPQLHIKTRLCLR